MTAWQAAAGWLVAITVLGVVVLALGMAVGGVETPGNKVEAECEPTGLVLVHDERAMKVYRCEEAA